MVYDESLQKSFLCKCKFIGEINITYIKFSSCLFLLFIFVLVIFIKNNKEIS